MVQILITDDEMGIIMPDMDSYTISREIRKRKNYLETLNIHTDISRNSAATVVELSKIRKDILP